MWVKDIEKASCRTKSKDISSGKDYRDHEDKQVLALDKGFISSFVPNNGLNPINTAGVRTEFSSCDTCNLQEIQRLTKIQTKIQKKTVFVFIAREQLERGAASVSWGRWKRCNLKHNLMEEAQHTNTAHRRDLLAGMERQNH